VEDFVDPLRTLIAVGLAMLSLVYFRVTRRWSE